MQVVVLYKLKQVSKIFLLKQETWKPDVINDSNRNMLLLIRCV